MKMKKHPTSNIEHPTSSLAGAWRGRFGCSMLDVECWMFPTNANG